MNSIMKPQKREVNKLGKFTIIGGENPALENEAKKGSFIQVIPTSTSSRKELESFEKEIKKFGFSKEDLKEIKSELREEIKEIKTNIGLMNQYGRYCPERIMKVIESLMGKKPITLGKINCLSYEISKIRISMTTPKRYEIVNGDKMTEENKIIEEENFFRVPVYRTAKDGNRYRKINRVVEEEVEFHSWNEKNEGELKNKDLMALYLSRRLGRLESKQRFKPLKDISKCHDEDQVIPGIRAMMKYGLIYVKIKDQLIPIKQLGRRVFRTRDKSGKVSTYEDNNYRNKNKNCLSFILNLKGEPLKVTPCRYYDPEMNQGDGGYREPRALSYNLIDYENNHIVVIARRPTLVHLKNRVEELHEEYTFFENKEGEVIHKPYGLTKQEESFVKSRNNKKGQFDESEIMELFQYLKEDIDGRETVRNMEHDIRNHYQMKYILQKSSKELFILKLVLDDTPEYAEEVLSEEEMARFDLMTLFVRNCNEKAEATKRKITALRNIVSELHLRIEEEEDMGKYLSDELEEIDKVSHDRESKHYKTHRNYYSQTQGILASNGNPQDTHKKVSNPPSMATIRMLRKQNQRKHKVDTLITDFEGVLWNVTPKARTKVHREYPWYPIKDILGMNKNDKDIFFHEDIDLCLHVLNEVEGYLSEQEISFVKDAIEEVRMMEKEKVLSPTFKLPTYPKEVPIEESLLKICNECPNEGKCFIEKVKRFNSLPKKQGRELIPIFNKKCNKKVSSYYNPEERRAYIDVLQFKQRKNTFAELTGQIAYELTKEYVHRNYGLKGNKFIFYPGIIKAKVLRKFHIKTDNYQEMIRENINSRFDINTFSSPMMQAARLILILKEEEVIDPIFKKIYHKSLNKAKEFMKIGEWVDSQLREPGVQKIHLIDRRINRREVNPPSPKSITKIGEDEYFIKGYYVDGRVYSLYAKGDLDALEYPKVGFSGTRKPVKETIDFVQRKTDELSDEFVIVSGLAEGCDTIAHERCLDNYGITIAVLPCGFNNIYPKENKELAKEIVENGGLLLSEYAPDETTSKEKLIHRNRIISGLSEKVVICQGGKGTSHTKRYAKEQGKDIVFQPKIKKQKN